MNLLFKLIIVVLISIKVEADRACAFVKCKNNERCVNRRFLCVNSSCPRMVFCAKTKTEFTNGPTSCENVKCSNGYICVVKVSRCSWNTPCKEQIARCITEMEYYEGPASCEGYKCPIGKDCILRESFCMKPPCKLIKSCFSKRDIHKWLEKCKSLGCLSSHECFLRKPDNVCEFTKCNHSPDCFARTASELNLYEQCRGWICPQGQLCTVQSNSRSCEQTDLSSTINSKNNSEVKNPPAFSTRSFFNSAPDKSSLYSLLENLNNESDIINFWVDQARADKNFIEFRQWLKNVRFLLGEDAFGLWLGRLKNVTEKKFHLWLPSADFNMEFWRSKEEKKNIYETDSLINPEYKLRSFTAPNNTTKNSTSLFYPKDPQFRLQDEVETTDNKNMSGYYLSVINQIDKLLGAIAPAIEYNQQSVLKKLANESAVLDDQKKVSLISVLQKLRDEREIYVYIINKTRELVAKAQPLVPSIYIDEIIDKLKENLTSGRRSEFGKNISDDSVVEIIATPDYENDNETEFFLVDYGEPITDLKVNQSVPRIVVRIENNMKPLPKIGTVKFNFAGNSHKLLNNTELRMKNYDYYSDDGIYDTSKRIGNKTN
ncbi:uncharacterized protein LOC130668773 [Microplitis mediator]|uniref:uncharacterized protein LOC130668773 n=1 Tax=Microplitis mediator TaxID=375433 RepID=UPI0025543A5B|nr:uncharacterized protein LOC130668773 [Microplitis mediator]